MLKGCEGCHVVVVLKAIRNGWEAFMSGCHFLLGNEKKGEGLER